MERVFLLIKDSLLSFSTPSAVWYREGDLNSYSEGLRNAETLGRIIRISYCEGRRDDFNTDDFSS